MIYKTKGEELNSKFEITYSGLVSMEEVPNIIKHLQEAYKEYQEVQKELKNQERLEESVQVNKANLSA